MRTNELYNLTTQVVDGERIVHLQSKHNGRIYRLMGRAYIMEGVNTYIGIQLQCVVDKSVCVTRTNNALNFEEYTFPTESAQHTEGCNAPVEWFWHRSGLGLCKFPSNN